MEERGQDGSDMMIEYGESEGLELTPFEDNKKGFFLMDSMMQCFSTALSFFNRADLKTSKDDDWVVPFESITDLVYLGSGAQGVVFSGVLNGEMVAVKKLRDKTETDINHLKKLDHENIVRFHGICTEAPCFCVIMEYCQYGPLFEFLHSGSCFAPKQIIKWAKEIAKGMTYLHNHKIIHRDLKSPNILITDNLAVKVSDFGTSREWNDVSAIMSFTGTVAWMAPEVIRHEPCSERVDVWSYGVVMWELITQEVPYKNLETHAIMWGVGTDTIGLPIPTTCPDSLQQLLTQCWSRNSRQRPSFKMISAHLDVAAEEMGSMEMDCFRATQAQWRREVLVAMGRFYAKPAAPGQQPEERVNRRDESRQARDIRQIYEQQLIRANELYMEVCAVKLQLEERERIIREREKALKNCRCGYRKNAKQYQQQTSSSSDGAQAARSLQVITEAPTRLRRSKPETHVELNYIESNNEMPSVAVTDTVECVCEDESIQNNNMDTVHFQIAVLEKNGNIATTSCHYQVANGHYAAACAQV